MMSSESQARSRCDSYGLGLDSFGLAVLLGKTGYGEERHPQIGISCAPPDELTFLPSTAA